VKRQASLAAYAFKAIVVMLNLVSAHGPSAAAPLLQAIGMTKRYGTFLANDSIDIDLYPGEIHALLGENGAGKSTLVKTMYGLIQPSAGELRWMGEKVVLVGPSAARAQGVGMVFQHFSLFDNLTVAENVALGLDGKESFANMSARLAQVSNDYGLPLDPKREVWRLSVGERQRIEIVRALMQNPKLLILDEPTAVLTPQEADQLFIVLERLRSEGRALLYISHKLEEVKRLCDTATILRGGKKVATCNPHEETATSLARMMVGADIGEVKAGTGRATTVPRLVIHELSLAPDDPHGTHLRSISLEVKGGEILGIAGVAGNGQDEFFAALSGERLSPIEGNIIFDGKAAGLMSVTERRRLGAAFVPEERLGHGTAPRMKLSENALLTGHAASHMVNHGFVDKPATLATVDKTTATFDVRKAKRDPEAASLSGGNLQKFIVGREILREPGVLVVSQPTWGVDAGAAAVIRQALLDLSGRGTAVLVISQDLDELAEIADRIAVMFHGHMSEPLAAALATREKLGLLMGGSAADQKEAPHAVSA
jgi:general nucleoside transport system ATP-binding protein